VVKSGLVVLQTPPTALHSVTLTFLLPSALFEETAVVSLLLFRSLNFLSTAFLSKKKCVGVMSESLNATSQYSLRLCGLAVRVLGYRREMYCVSCEVRTEFIYVEESKPPLWSSGQSSWL
jgi:hypothetical protein